MEEVVVVSLHLSVTLGKPVLPDIGVMLPFTLIMCVCLMIVMCI